MVLGTDGDDLGADRGDDRAHEGVRRGVGVVRRREDPRRPLEKGGVGPVDAFLLRSRHRVAADKTRVAHRVHDRRLHAAHVGDHTRAGEGAASLAGNRPDWCGYEGDIGLGVVADVVQGTQLQGASCPRLVDVPARHVPVLRTQGQADGAADQPGTDDEGSTSGAHRSGPWPSPDRRAGDRPLPGQS